MSLFPNVLKNRHYHLISIYFFVFYRTEYFTCLFFFNLVYFIFPNQHSTWAQQNQVGWKPRQPPKIDLAFYCKPFPLLVPLAAGHIASKWELAFFLGKRPQKGERRKGICWEQTLLDKSQLFHWYSFFKDCRYLQYIRR